jgi:WD40 repeat protein
MNVPTPRVNREVKAPGILQSKLTDALFGYDWFISYARNDGTAYVLELCEQLARHDFRCFLDGIGFFPGERLVPATRRAIRRTTVFLLVASPGALQSPHVRAELKEAIRRGKTVIPIDVGGVLRSDGGRSGLVAMLGDRLWIDEDGPALGRGPSPAVMGELLRTFTFTRRSRLQQRVFAGAAALFLAVSAVASLQTWRAKQSQRVAEAARRATETALSREKLARTAEAAARKKAEEESNRANELRASERRARLLAERARSEEHEARLVAEGLNLVEKDPSVAATEFLAALALHPRPHPDTLRAIRAWTHRKLERTVGDFAQPVLAVDWSADGRFLALASDDVGVWETKEWKMIRSLPLGHDVNTLRFSPDGQVLAIGSDHGELTVWPHATPSISWRKRIGTGRVDTIEWLRDGGSFFTATTDGFLLRLARADGQSLPPTRHRQDGHVTSVALDATLALVAWSDGLLSEVSLGTFAAKDKKDAIPAEAILAVPPDGGYMVAGHPDGTVIFSSQGTPRILSVNQPLRMIAARDRVFAVADLGGAVSLFEVNEEATKAALRFEPGGLPTGLALAPRGEHVAVAFPGENRVRVYRGISPRQNDDERDGIARMAWSPDRSLLAIGRINGGLWIYPEGNPSLRVECARLDSYIGDLAWIDHGRYLVAATGSGRFSVWTFEPARIVANPSRLAGSLGMQDLPEIRSAGTEHRDTRCGLALMGGMMHPVPNPSGGTELVAIAGCERDSRFAFAAVSSRQREYTQQAIRRADLDDWREIPFATAPGLLAWDEGCRDLFRLELPPSRQIQVLRGQHIQHNIAIPGDIRAVRFSSRPRHRQVVVGTADAKVLLIDPEEPSPVRWRITLTHELVTLRDLAWTGDGAHLGILGPTGYVVVLDADTGAEVDRFDSGGDSSTSGALAWHPGHRTWLIGNGLTGEIRRVPFPATGTIVRAMRELVGDDGRRSIRSGSAARQAN